MASSIATLASNLITSDFRNFRETDSVPYKYTDSWEKFEETSLPPEDLFYSTLTEADITNE